MGIFFSVQVGNSFDVVFRNRLDIPCGTLPDKVQSLMWEGEKIRPNEHFFTETLVLDKNAAVATDFREQFIAFMESPGDQKMPGCESRYFQAITSLNDAIVGYHHATNSLFGGAVVALEGAHSALLQIRLDRRMAASITDATIRAKKVESTANWESPSEMRSCTL